METTLKVHKDNGLLVNIVELSFDEYHTLRDALFYSAMYNKSMLERFDGVAIEETASRWRKEHEEFMNLYKKLSL